MAKKTMNVKMERLNKPHENNRFPIDRYDAVFFDVDSTLVTIEGLDWLAEHKGVGEQVKELTKNSMNGRVDFHAAMIEKMKLIAPSNKDFELLGQAYCDHLVDGVKDVISELHAREKEVWILTGNFQPAVGILARHIGVPQDRVICNEVFFDQSGSYVGFDVENELAHNGGKAKKIRLIANFAYKKRILVGDGATDLEAKNEVSLFIGFGGVVERSKVKEESDVYITEPSLYPLLHILIEKSK